MDKRSAEPHAPGALRRGLSILNAIRAAGPDGLRVPEIAALTGLHRPTVYRLLEVLQQEGYVGPVGAGRRFGLADVAAARSDPWYRFTEQMKPVLRHIAAVTENCVFLIRRDDVDSVCLHREIGKGRLQILAQDVGARKPLGVGAASVALLSGLPDEQVRSILDANEGSYPAYGALSRAIVQRLVGTTRGRGYAVVENYALKGVRGVGVAVRDRLGRPIGALSVTAISHRLPLAAQRTVARLIREELERVDVAGPDHPGNEAPERGSG